VAIFNSYVNVCHRVHLRSRPASNHLDSHTSRPGAGSVSSRSQSPHPHWHSRKAVGLAGSSGYTAPNVWYVWQFDNARPPDQHVLDVEQASPHFQSLEEAHQGLEWLIFILTNGKVTNPDQIPNGFCPTARTLLFLDHPPGPQVDQTLDAQLRLRPHINTLVWLLPHQVPSFRSFRRQDLAKKKIINCWYVRTLVLDEADVMLSEAWMGWWDAARTAGGNDGNDGNRDARRTKWVRRLQPSNSNSRMICRPGLDIPKRWSQHFQLVLEFSCFNSQTSGHFAGDTGRHSSNYRGALLFCHLSRWCSTLWSRLNTE